jgi:hypothetical protein
MRAILMCLLGSATLALAQAVGQADRRSRTPCGTGRRSVSLVMQSIYVPAIADAPFSATVHAEWIKPLGNGGTMTLVIHD